MTYEEAIAELDKCKGNVEALRMAKEALGKQIPRKTIEDGYRNLPKVCPCCGNDELYDDCQHIYKYCTECGQKILMG